MSKPQSPELRRSGRTEALDPDNTATRLQARRGPSSRGRTGPVPPANQPGHHPPHEQDQPDPAAFVERFDRTDAPAEPSDGADMQSGPGDGPGSGIRERSLVCAATEAAGHGVAAAQVAIRTPVRRVRAVAAWALRSAADRIEPPADTAV